MMKRKLILILIFFCQLGLAHEPREGKLVASFGPFVLHSHNITNPGIHTSPLMGAVLAVEGDVDENGGIEISMGYFQKIYSREEDPGRENIEKVKRIHITMGYRHWFSSKFSGALSLASGYSIGDTFIIHSDYSPLLSRPSSSAKDPVEYGFETSLQWEAWTHEKYAAVVDLRYLHSVTSKQNEDGNHYGVLLAFKYEIQEKGIRRSKIQELEPEMDK